MVTRWLNVRNILNDMNDSLKVECEMFKRNETVLIHNDTARAVVGILDSMNEMSEDVNSKCKNIIMRYLIRKTVSGIRLTCKEYINIWYGRRMSLVTDDAYENEAKEIDEKWKRVLKNQEEIYI